MSCPGRCPHYSEGDRQRLTGNIRKDLHPAGAELIHRAIGDRLIPRAVHDAAALAGIVAPGVRVEVGQGVPLAQVVVTDTTGLRGGPDQEGDGADGHVVTSTRMTRCPIKRNL